MPITSAHERPQPPTSPAFSDAVTFAFADADADVFGMARIGLSAGGAEVHGSGMGIVFAAREPVAVRAAGGIPVPGDAGDAGFGAVDAAGVRSSVEEPLRSWTVSFVSEDATVAFDLRFRALGDPAEVPAGGPVATLGGMQGYEHLCHVTGTARVRGGERRIDCLGQRGHSWGAPDWDRITVARSVSAWLDDDLGVSLVAVRPLKAKGHADEALQAAIFTAPDEHRPEGAVRVVVPEDSRLSTTYDAEGRQRRAGLELYEDEDGPPHRGAGEVLCGTSLDLGRLRLDCSFFRWRFDGREGLGRYDIVRRAEDLA